MKAVKTWIRTKSGRLVEKTILMTKEDYEKLEQLKKEGKDPNEIFSKYMSMKNGDKIESWSKKEGRAMKVGCFSFNNWSMTQKLSHHARWRPEKSHGTRKMKVNQLKHNLRAFTPFTIVSYNCENALHTY